MSPSGGLRVHSFRKTCPVTGKAPFRGKGQDFTVCLGQMGLDTNLGQKPYKLVSGDRLATTKVDTC